MKTEIIFEDKDICVVYKPAGFPAQTAKVGAPDVVSDLKNYLRRAGGTSPGRGMPYLGIVHRLDQPVEGLMVLGKNQKAAASLSGQLGGEDGGETFHKRYYAVLCGSPAQAQGELADFLAREKSGRAVIVQPQEAPEARLAVLEYRILQVRDVLELRDPPVLQGADAAGESAWRELSLADIRIRTGRFHQIRVQMAHAGMPLLGDSKYGDELSKALSRELGVRTAALCAYRLEFLHPVSGREMHFEVKPRGRAFSFFSQA